MSIPNRNLGLNGIPKTTPQGNARKKRKNVSSCYRHFAEILVEEKGTDKCEIPEVVEFMKEKGLIRYSMEQLLEIANRHEHESTRKSLADGRYRCPRTGRRIRTWLPTRVPGEERYIWVYIPRAEKMGDNVAILEALEQFSKGPENDIQEYRENIDYHNDRWREMGLPLYEPRGYYLGEHTTTVTVPRRPPKKKKGKNNRITED